MKNKYLDSFINVRVSTSLLSRGKNEFESRMEDHFWLIGLIFISMIKTALVIVSIVILALCAFGVSFSNVALLPLGLAVYIGSKLC